MPTRAFMLIVAAVLTGGLVRAGPPSDRPGVATTNQAERADEAPSLTTGGARLRARLSELLGKRDLEGALLEAQRAWRAAPDDAGVRAEFIDLHLSLARQAMRDEDFAFTERILTAVSKVDPAHPEAGRIRGVLSAARETIPVRTAQARDWLAIEWFEPAFRTLSQARSLSPERAAEWLNDTVAAATGSGDDHYLTKNFHDAFYFYDAAIKLSADGRQKAPASLVSRWLQSMVHALGDDVDRVAYPPAYWKSALERVGGLAPRAPGDDAMIAILRGLAYEDLELYDEATAQYARVTGVPVTGVADAIRRHRTDALRAVRKWHDASLTGRRGGAWRVVREGDWLAVKSERFEVYHHNAEVGRRVQDAMAFHYGRIARLFGVTGDAVPWPTPCKIYIHGNIEEFRKATGQKDAVQAISVTQLRGRKLVSQTIHACQTDPLLLSTTLAHELGHLMMGALTEHRAVPAAIAEGVALHVEPRCRHVQFDRLFLKLQQPRELATLLAIKEAHPAESPFYAESHRLVSILSRARGVEALLQEVEALQSVQGLANVGGFQRNADLVNAYLGRDLNAAGARAKADSGPPKGTTSQGPRSAEADTVPGRRSDTKGEARQPRR